MSKLKKFLITTGIIAVALFFLSIRDIPEEITYGVSFSKFHADELKLDWKETYLALLNDLRVKHFRFSAHWPNTEPQEGKYNFTELDFQMAQAQSHGAEVILAVGRRLPGWPECHDPEWVKSLTVEERREKLLKTIEVIVNRYKDNPALKYWQIENEPFLGFFSRSYCMQLDKEFFEKEIALVKKLDSSRPVIITSSGEFDPWFQAYKRADIFGSSLYLYVWWRNGPMRYPITPGFFRIKQNLMELVYGKKPKILIELSTEPWLLQPIITVPVELQLQRMGIDKFREMVKFASKTGFEKQYFWGTEWWYWLKKQGLSEHWEEAKKLF